jgi:AcrR family transcriptional regulator
MTPQSPADAAADVAGAKPGRPYHHGDLRTALLAEASLLLEQEGVEAVTFRGLARRLGVSHAAPGYHFGDREHLLLELGAHGHVLLTAAMQSRLDEGVDEPLVAIGKGYLDFAMSHPQHFRLMFAGVAGLNAGAHAAFVQAGSRSGAMLVTTATGSADPADDPARWLKAWALVHGLATLWNDGGLGGGFADWGGQEAFRSLADGILTEAFSARRPARRSRAVPDGPH